MWDEFESNVIKTVDKILFGPIIITHIILLIRPVITGIGGCNRLLVQLYTPSMHTTVYFWAVYSLKDVRCTTQVCFGPVILNFILLPFLKVGIVLETFYCSGILQVVYIFCY